MTSPSLHKVYCSHGPIAGLEDETPSCTRQHAALDTAVGTSRLHADLESEQLWREGVEARIAADGERKSDTRRVPSPDHR